jgi:CheY-like chemotaxis protein
VVEKGFVGVVMEDKSTLSPNAREAAGRTTQQIKPHLLIVDDDRELCEVLKRYLEAEDFRVSFAHTGEAGTKAGIEGSFELIVLDVMLPDKKGFNVLKDIRQRARTPVLMLTARGEEFDRILGLELVNSRHEFPPFSADRAGSPTTRTGLGLQKSSLETWNSIWVRASSRKPAGL